MFSVRFPVTCIHREGTTDQGNSLAMHYEVKMTVAQGLCCLSFITPLTSAAHFQSVLRKAE